MKLFNYLLMLGFVFINLGCNSTYKKNYAVKDVKKYNAQTFYETTFVWNAVFSNDENSVLFSSDKSGIFNIYEVPFAGGQEKQKTHSLKNTNLIISSFPKDERLIYSSDSEGNERSHVYVLDKKGKVKDLTPGKNTKAHFLKWHQDEKHFYVISNKRDPKFFDVYKYNAQTYRKTMVFKNIDGFNPGDISRDGRWLALTKTNSNMDSDLYLVDLIAKDTTPILVTAHTGNVEYSVFTFTPNSNELIYSTNAHGEFSQAWSYDLENKTHKLYYKDQWDIFYIHFSEKGNLRVIATNNDAQTVLELTNMQSGKKIQLPAINGNVVSVRFSKSETKMILLVNSDTSPTDIYTFSFNDNKLNRLTNSLSPNIAQDELVHSEVVRYKSFDGLEIPSLLYRPWKANVNNKVPAIVFVHGGPGGQSRKGYQAMIQHLVNNGYAVLSVNNRGSNGYGKTFYHLDDKKHGQDDLKDCIWGRKYLESLPFVNKSQVAIMGGSYGGYMTAAALTFAPKEFDAGINIFGVTNWLRTIESIPPWWASHKDYLITEIGDPKKDREALIAKSPLFHANKIEKPFLVVQGANDPRVLQVESDEIVAAARKNNVPVKYVLFKDEGHGFTKKQNRISASEAYLKFLDTHLKK